MARAAVATAPLGCGLLLALMASLGQAAAAPAGHLTYCVGGFEFDAFFPTRQQCKKHDDIHPRWHFHNFVRGPDGRCRECWDECDQTCVTGFLRDHPEFSDIDPLDCRQAGAFPPTGEEIRVEKGEVVKAPPALPPPPAPVELLTEILRVSAGPYAAGDTVRVDARVRTPQGQTRQVQGGEIIVRGADGSEKLRVPVRPLPGGGVSAELKIPVGGNLSLSFQPRGIALSADETVGKVQPEATALNVNPCRLRGAVLTPRDGEVVAAGTQLALRGQVRAHAGGPVGATELSAGTRAVFVLELASGKTLEVAAQLDASGAATASMLLPVPTADSETPALRLLGRDGSGDFCPDAPAVLRLSRLGVGIDITEPQPESSCYVGRACRIAARFRLPQAGSAQTLAAAFVADPMLQLAASTDGEPIATLQPSRTPDGATIYSASFPPQQARAVEIELTASARGQEVKERVHLRIRPPLSLKLPAALDFGLVAAGTARERACQTLDFHASSGAEEQHFGLQATLTPPCRSTLHIVDGHGRFYPLDREQSFRLESDRSVRICLDVPRCAGDSPAPASLRVRALSPDFPEQQATVQLRWQVSARSFLSCHLWWIVIASGVLLLLFIVYGFIRPSHFSADDSIKIASKQVALQRAVPRRLRELPGGRAGFYRSAATGLREDGSATGSKRQALLTLLAAEGDVLLFCRGALQRYNPQSRKLETVTVEKRGYPLSKNTVYCVGVLFFQVG